MKTEEARRDLQTVGRQMVDLGLAWGNAGNISARTEEDCFLITATGTRLGELADDDFAEDDDLFADDFGFERFSFWRGTVGLTFRW